MAVDPTSSTYVDAIGFAALVVDESPVRVELCGELDARAVEGLDLLVRRQMTVGEGLVLDLSRLTFVDSTGVALLLALDQWVQARGGGLRLAAPRPNVQRVLAVTGLRGRFEIDDA